MGRLLGQAVLLPFSPDDHLMSNENRFPSLEEAASLFIVGGSETTGEFQI